MGAENRKRVPQSSISFARLYKQRALEHVEAEGVLNPNELQAGVVEELLRRPTGHAAPTSSGICTFITLTDWLGVDYIVCAASGQAKAAPKEAAALPVYQRERKLAVVSSCCSAGW